MDILRLEWHQFLRLFHAVCAVPNYSRGNQNRMRKMDLTTLNGLILGFALIMGLGLIDSGR